MSSRYVYHLVDKFGKHETMVSMFETFGMTKNYKNPIEKMIDDFIGGLLLLGFAIGIAIAAIITGVGYLVFRAF